MSLLAPLAPDAVALDDAVSLTASYCLLSRIDDTVSMHRLVQAVIRGHRDDPGPLRLAIDLLQRALPPCDREPLVDDWPQWAVLVPYVRAAVTSLSPEEWLAQPAELVVARAQIAWPAVLYLRSQGQVAVALDLLAQAHDDLSRSLGDDHPVTWRPAWTCGSVLTVPAAAMGDHHVNRGPLRLRPAVFIARRGWRADS